MTPTGTDTQTPGVPIPAIHLRCAAGRRTRVGRYERLEVSLLRCNDLLQGKRKANNALAQRGLMCSMLMVPGDSASMSSTVVAPGSFVNTSRKYA